MKRGVRLSILIIVFLASLIISLNKVNLPSVYQEYDNNFSALNVIEDIKFVSKEPHSVKHPEERERVRDYLFTRLNSLGLNTIYLKYDSIKDRFGECINIANLYAVSEPSRDEKCSSYILLVAHLDSRFKLQRKGEWVTSFGAADDGYGIGVIFELIRVSNYYKDNWNQGIKVLFTDSEESDLEGIKNTVIRDKQVFDNVGFVINIEARGVKGPAVMFETSDGNSKIMELFSKGNSLFSYSFTSAVYSVLPNYTDFTVIKDSFPGINFAVIDNLNYYHTEKDNFSNISLNSIQHYGSQISPIMLEYLTQKKYSDPNYLKTKSDNFYFSLPLFGFVLLSPAIYIILIITGLSIYFIVLIKKFFQRKSSLRFFKSLFIIIISVLITTTINFCISYLSAIFNEVNFNLTYLPFINGDSYIFIFSLIFTILSNLLIYRYIKQKIMLDYCEIHLSALLPLVILTILSHYFIGDSILFSYVMILSVISLMFHKDRILKNYTFLPLFLILIFSVPVVYLLNVALTTGSLSIILSYVSLLVWQIMPITDGYLKREI